MRPTYVGGDSPFRPARRVSPAQARVSATAAASPELEEASATRELARVLSLRDAIALVLTVIGTGVFLKTATMAQLVGTPSTGVARVGCGGAVLSARRRTDLRRAGRDDAGGRRRLRLPPRSLWQPGGIPFRLDQPRI